MLYRKRAASYCGGSTNSFRLNDRKATRRGQILCQSFCSFSILHGNVKTHDGPIHFWLGDGCACDKSEMILLRGSLQNHGISCRNSSITRSNKRLSILINGFDLHSEANFVSKKCHIFLWLISRNQKKCWAFFAYLFFVENEIFI